jgi:hypothetical protein
MTVIPLYKPPSRKQAETIIRALVREGRVELHPHCKLRQRRRAITYVQILNCLARGYVDEDPYQSPHHKGWETAVVGSAAGERLRIVVCLRWSQDVLVITCYQQ